MPQSGNTLWVLSQGMHHSTTCPLPESKDALERDNSNLRKELKVIEDDFNSSTQHAADREDAPALRQIHINLLFRPRNTTTDNLMFVAILSPLCRPYGKEASRLLFDALDVTCLILIVAVHYIGRDQ
ncbi:hypothetical protein RB195_020640 [Necator americanus]|uniref:Uncharacterized protein n=1 Tax=Necator americanus TaxID=51031 RepID=A0ABR1CL73_NECAM